MEVNRIYENVCTKMKNEGYEQKEIKFNLKDYLISFVGGLLIIISYVLLYVTFDNNRESFIDTFNILSFFVGIITYDLVKNIIILILANQKIDNFEFSSNNAGFSIIFKSCKKLKIDRVINIYKIFITSIYILLFIVLFFQLENYLWTIILIYIYAILDQFLLIKLLKNKKEIENSICYTNPNGYGILYFKK